MNVFFSDIYEAVIYQKRKGCQLLAHSYKPKYFHLCVCIAKTAHCDYDRNSIGSSSTVMTHDEVTVRDKACVEETKIGHAHAYTKRSEARTTLNVQNESPTH